MPDNPTPERLAALKTDLDACEQFWRRWKTADSENERRTAAFQASEARDRLSLPAHQSTIRALLEERERVERILAVDPNKCATCAYKFAQLYDGAKQDGAREAYKAVREQIVSMSRDTTPEASYRGALVILRLFLDEREREAQS